MSAPIGLLIDGDGLDLREIQLGTGLIHVMVQYPPDPRVVLTHKARNGIHGHLADQNHQQALEHQREARTLSRPGDIDGLDSVFVAVAARHPDREISRMLEEV